MLRAFLSDLFARQEPPDSESSDAASGSGAGAGSELPAPLFAANLATEGPGVLKSTFWA